MIDIKRRWAVMVLCCSVVACCLSLFALLELAPIAHKSENTLREVSLKGFINYRSQKVHKWKKAHNYEPFHLVIKKSVHKYCAYYSTRFHHLQTDFNQCQAVHMRKGSQIGSQHMVVTSAKGL